jgi:predicted ATPase
LDFKLKVKSLKDGFTLRLTQPSKKDSSHEISRIGKKRPDEIEILYLELMMLTLDIISSKILENIKWPCYYLPAARSGILQGHKALAEIMWRKIPYVGIEEFEIPKFSGVVSDFISSIISLPGREGPFYQLVEDFEKELVKGNITVRTLDEYSYPEIHYNFKNAEIPLHRASSTVSELAPLFLYLKYIVKPGSILIIEEPEAHLHPENQRILAKFLVKLVRNGVKIVITTHSEYLLEQLSSFILLSKVPEEKRVEKYKYSKEDYLLPNEISAYVFNYDKRSNGHKITEIEITEEDGISQDEFLKIHEALYEESLKLRKDIEIKK